MKLAEPTELHRKSGMWGTPGFVTGLRLPDVGHPSIAFEAVTTYGERNARVRGGLGLQGTQLYLGVAGIGMFLVWLRVAAALYAVASVSALPAVLYNRPGWKRICVPAAVSAFFFHFVSLIEMLSASHHSLPVGMHEVQSLLALLICAAFLLVALLYRTVSFGIFALPLSLLLVLGPAIGPDHWTFHSPGIRSGWLSLHIIALLAAYAALIFSLFANFLYLVQERRLKNKSNVAFLAWLPPLETMERIASGMLLIGFPFMTLGLLAGSLIAQESVGPAYFKDPKVLLSFAMWGLYLVMLFVRRQAGLRGRRAVYLSSLTFLVVISVWAANQFSSVHRFTAP
jgi:ABC-type uncharacterized transport system permease subunit